MLVLFRAQFPVHGMPQILNKHLLNIDIHYGPGVALGAWDISVNKAKVSALLEIAF